MASRNGQERRAAKRAYRLRVVAHELGRTGTYGTVRDVYLESAYTPEWTIDMSTFGMDATRVADMCRWADFHTVPVVFDPPGNMDMYFRKSKKNEDEQGVLFS